MRVALYRPDIAGNVGTILRLSTCLKVGVDLIEPMGFAWGDRALARAGMDYLDTAEVVRHVDWYAFAAQVPGRIVLLMPLSGGVRIEREPSSGAGRCAPAWRRARRRALSTSMRGLTIFGSAPLGCGRALAGRSGRRGGSRLGEALRQTRGWPVD